MSRTDSWRTLQHLSDAMHRFHESAALSDECLILRKIVQKWTILTLYRDQIVDIVAIYRIWVPTEHK